MGRPDGNDVFVDSTVLYALLDSAHEAHDRVVAAWDKLLLCGARLVTSSYVCAELLALVQARLGSDKAQEFLRELRPHLRVLTVDAQLHARALADGKRDLSDLVPRISRGLMLRFGSTTAFSLDGRLGELPSRGTVAGRRAESASGAVLCARVRQCYEAVRQRGVPLRRGPPRDPRGWETLHTRNTAAARERRPYTDQGTVRREQGIRYSALAEREAPTVGGRGKGHRGTATSRRRRGFLHDKDSIGQSGSVDQVTEDMVGSQARRRGVSRVVRDSVDHDAERVS